MIDFKARNMPVTLLRRSGEAYQNPNWSRLQKHIAKHEKAGGWSSIRFRTPEEPVEVEGFKVVRFADIDLFSPLA
jgi:hypothetical protein